MTKSTILQERIKDQIVWFAGVAFAMSILLSLFIGFTGGHASPYIAAGYISMLIPAVTVFLLHLILRMAYPVVEWDVFPISWLPLALFLLPASLHAVLLPTYAHFSGNGLPWLLRPHILLNMPMGLIIVSLLAFFEEVGWRAWLLPRLMQIMSARKAVALAALLCAIWHTPYDLSGVHYIDGVKVPVQAVLNLPGEFGAAVVFGYLWVRTRSIWIVCIAHGALNDWGQLAFKYLPDVPPGNSVTWLLGAVNGTLFLTGIVALAHLKTKL